MNILSIVHDPTAPAGLVGEAIARRGGRYDELMPHLGEPLPEAPNGYDGLVILGGCMDADDDSGYPHFQPLLSLARAFHEERRPVMGICLGAQLLARAFGGTVRRMGQPEIGFAETVATRAGVRDPLLKGLGRAQRLMQWHQDTFDVPAGASLIMTGQDCPNQAFRIGATTYAFQFHLEATKSIVRTWLKVNEDFLRERDHPFAADAERQLAAHWDGQARFTAALADRWLDLVEAGRAGAVPRLRAVG